MNYDQPEFRRFHDAYLPSPVKKSAAMLKLQQKWGEASDSPKAAKRNFTVQKADDFYFVRNTRTTGMVKFDTESRSSAPVPVLKEVPFIADEEKPEGSESSEVAVEQAKVAPVKAEPKLEKKKAKKDKKTKPYKAKAPSSCTTVTRQGWDFGKRKVFVRPEDNRETNEAATQIQRLARGGMQRLHYQIRKLQHLLDTRQQRTDDAIAKIHELTFQRKETFRRKAEEQAAKGDKKLQMVSATAEESQRIIAYLRKENKKLREKNEQLYSAIQNLKAQNARLEDANAATDTSFNTLQEHAKHIEETHKKLIEIVPKYQESVETLLEAVEVRRQYCEAEHKIKVMYVKLVGQIVERMEDAPGQSKLAEEIMECCVNMEGHEHGLVMPNKVDGHNSGLDRDSDDSDLDEYTVHTMDD